MEQIERQLTLAEVSEQPSTPAHLLTLRDTPREETLNETQQETVQQLRAAIVTRVVKREKIFRRSVVYHRQSHFQRKLRQGYP